MTLWAEVGIFIDVTETRSSCDKLMSKIKGCGRTAGFPICTFASTNTRSLCTHGDICSATHCGALCACTVSAMHVFGVQTLARRTSNCPGKGSYAFAPRAAFWRGSIPSRVTPPLFLLPLGLYGYLCSISGRNSPPQPITGTSQFAGLLTQPCW